MVVPITVVNLDLSETVYASIDEMPSGALKTEIAKVIVRNPHATAIRKILR